MQQRVLPVTIKAMLADVRRQAAAGTQDRGEAEVRVPVTRYHDPAWLAAERATLFSRLPLIVAHSSEIRPGEALANDASGVPILLVRDEQGTLRAFLNVCRHRGMRLLEPAASAAAKKSLVCGYHGWTYQLDGRLRHRAWEDAFDPLPEEQNALVPLPCEERHGFVWVIPARDAEIDIAEHLGVLDAELAWFGIDGMTVFRTVDTVYAANWKLIMDAFLEYYHIRILHRDTIQPFFANGVAGCLKAGPHIAAMVARKTALEEFADPLERDALCKLVTPTYVLFPNTVLVNHPDYLSLITVFPTGPDSHRWVHRMLIPVAKATPDWTPHWEKTFRLLEETVFEKEDVATAVAIQQGILCGANTHMTFGRVERNVGWFHDEVARAVGRAG
ncbi:MAG: aromatic ring-hydroxylating dioxygenase subunit alpha [Burkholderiales bacterium]|nr:aromatic ring-hydroxylating dioxygenase subunit alpha [Burkholderiales bacterium]